MRDPFDRETNHLNRIFETHFFLDVRTMRFNGLWAQVEFESDVLGCKSTSKQFDNLKFSFESLLRGESILSPVG